jgi:hypothetical protein
MGEADDVPAVKSDFVLKLVAARLTGGDPAPILARQRQRYLQSLRDLDVLAPADAGGDGVQALLVEGAALHLDAELRWLDLCERRLHELAPKARTNDGNAT